MKLKIKCKKYPRCINPKFKIILETKHLDPKKHRHFIQAYLTYFILKPTWLTKSVKP